MACRTLLRRRTQLNLLSQACEQACPASISVRGRREISAALRLATLERDGVLAAWANGRVPEIEVAGQAVEVRFEHEGESYVFRSVSRGCVGGEPTAAATPLLKLSLPLNVARARGRQHVRLTVQGLPSVVGTFTHVVDGRKQFKAHLTNVGDGGVGVTARRDEVPQLHTGDLFWIDVVLPGEQTRSEFVVRLAYLRPVVDSDELVMGWAFQPGDESANYETCVRRLEAFVARQVSSQDQTD
jgi:hypothetical protein